MVSEDREQKRKGSNGVSNPHPPSSCGTLKDETSDSPLRSYVSRLVSPIVAKTLGEVPQEASFNTMSIIPRVFKIAWRPNNYRLKVNILPYKDSTLEKLNSSIVVKCVRRTGVFFARYHGVTLMLGKGTLTGIWSQRVVNGLKETFLLEANTIQDLEGLLLRKREEIRGMISRALVAFCEEFGLVVVGEPLWDRYEDWVKGEEVIDSLPESLVIHDTVFKKVYGEGLEFKQSPAKEAPVVNLKQYLKNRALEDFAPLIAVELAGVREELLLLNPVRRVLEKVVVFPDDLLRVDVQAIVGGMSREDRLRLSVELFEKFGEGVSR